MKKLMFAAAVVAAAFGLKAELASANVVGYQTKKLDAGKFAILGIQFEGVDGSLDINKIVTGLIGVNYDESGAFLKTAPHIQVPNAATGGYDLYYYLNDGWYNDGTDAGAYKAGWCDSFGVIAGPGADVSGEFTSGVAIWAKDVQNSGALQQSGQVPNGDEPVEVTAPSIFALRANAFPIAFNLNDSSKIEFSGIDGVNYDEAGAFLKTAPHIQVPNATTGGYDLYYYLNDGWYNDGTDAGAYKAGWCDSFGVIAGPDADVSGDVPAGIGFWTKGVGGEFTITFK